MPQEKPAFFVEFFRNPLTEAYPEVFQPLGDGIELTRWWLGHDDPRRCSLFSLFAIRHENRWGLDAVRNSVLDVDTRIYGSSSKPPSLIDGKANLFKLGALDWGLKSVECSREC